MEEDVQHPVLTPNSLIFGQTNLIPTEEDKILVEKDLRKRFKYVQACKNAAWSRWSKEYVTELRERHNLKNKVKNSSPDVGEVVMIKGDHKSRGKWTIGVVTKTYVGKDGIVRAVELRTSRCILERAIQHLYPLELFCDESTTSEQELNVEADEFRPKRNAAAIARFRIEDQADYELHQ